MSDLKAMLERLSASASRAARSMEPRNSYKYKRLLFACTFTAALYFAYEFDLYFFGCMVFYLIARLVANEIHMSEGKDIISRLERIEDKVDCLRVDA